MAQPLLPEIALFGQPYRRNCSIFSAWKAQRVRDAYLCLSGEDRERADELTAAIGWEDLLGLSTDARMERVGFALQRSG